MKRKINVNLFTEVFVVMREIASRYGIHTLAANQMCEEVFLELLRQHRPTDPQQEPADQHNAICGIILRKMEHLEIERSGCPLTDEDISWMVDLMEEANGKILENQIRFFADKIDGYLVKNPRCFTRQNRKLWAILKQQTHTKSEIMTLMQFEDRGTYYTAKNRLVNRLIALYRNPPASSQH